MIFFARIFLIAIIVVSATTTTAQVETTTQDGDWQTNSTWTDNSEPGITGLGGNSITVNHKVVAGTFGGEINMTFAANNESRALTINDTLIIHGNVTFSNKAMDFNIGSATVIITGDLTVGNRLDLDSDGTLVVMGKFSKTGSQGSFTGSGTV